MLLEHLPPDSATVSAQRGGPYWPLEAHLLDDLRMAHVHSKKHPAKPHPLRPVSRKKVLDPRRLTEGRRRRQERKRAIEAGEIT